MFQGSIQNGNSVSRELQELGTQMYVEDMQDYLTIGRMQNAWVFHTSSWYFQVTLEDLSVLIMNVQYEFGFG